jgi:uncharacterized protein YbjQ (UPF0145 family)
MPHEIANTMTECSGGTFKGAFTCASGLDAQSKPRKLRNKQKVNVAVPRGMRAGDSMVVMIEGEMVELTIPDNFDPTRSTRFTYLYPGDVDKVIASTLQSCPGHEIVLSRPIIWSSVSSCDTGNEENHQTEGHVVGNLMRKVQEQLLATAIDEECNAVLGINFNVTTARSGENDVLIVTAYGTPCTVVPSKRTLKPWSIPSTKTIAYEDSEVGFPAV